VFLSGTGTQKGLACGSLSLSVTMKVGVLSVAKVKQLVYSTDCNGRKFEQKRKAKWVKEKANLVKA